MAPLDQLWPQADYIVIHVPLIPRTKNLLCASTLARCRKGVKIINMAKAGIMNEVDMLQALNKGRVGGAAFDVYVEVSTPFLTILQRTLYLPVFMLLAYGVSIDRIISLKNFRMLRLFVG